MKIVELSKGVWHLDRPETKGREKLIYGELRTDAGRLIISATLDYIIQKLLENPEYWNEDL